MIRFRISSLHYSIIAILVVVFITISQNASAQTAHDILQERDNTPVTHLSYNGAILIINQTTSKLEYKMGENITIHPEMINIGTVPATVINGQPLFDIQVINQNGTTVFDSGYSGMLIVGWGFTLNPGVTMHDNKTWGWNPQAATPVIKLDTPGKYIVLTESNISLYNTAEESSHAIPAHPTKSLWSKPIQITILSEQYMQNETNSSASKISSNQTSILAAEPIANPECVDKIMAQEHAQNAPIDDIHALDLAKNYTPYKLKTLGHNYTLNRIYHDFSVDSSSCNAQIKNVIVEFVEKNSLGHSLITITEDLGGDRVKNLDISQIHDEPVTHANAYMTPMEPQIDDNLILFIVLVIGVISVVTFFIFRIRKKR